MKKLLALALTLAMVFALAIPTMAQNVVLPSAPKANIVIDGVLDDGYGDPHILNSYRDGNGDGATAKMWSAWNETGIFYYLEVYDVTPNHDHGNQYERDNIELFIDWYSNGKGQSADSVSEADDCWQIRIASAPNEDGNQSSGSLGDDTLVTGTNFVVKPLVGGDLNGGYIMEVWLPISYTNDAKALASGDKIFVDFQIADNQEDEGRSSQVFIDGMADGTDSQWSTPDTFQGVLVLGDAKPEPVVEVEEEAPAVGGGDAAPEPPPVAAPAPAPAPATGDSGIMLIALMAIAAFGVAALKKRTDK